MTNNLLNLKKNLKSFAKRCKDFKYTDSALLAFLLSGMLISNGQVFAETVTNSQINNQVSQINTSINQMRTDFKRARAENNKLIKDTNLELIQLMEQGDHVVKSPWSSWQYGVNTILNDWKGSYKGRGDKAEKYPYEGILERSSDPYERSVSPDSKNYSLLSKTTDPRSASSNNRQGMKGYGIASTKQVKEPIVGFEVNAGIRPKQVNKGTIPITAKSANVPDLPEAISFVAPVVNLPNIGSVTVDIPSVTPPSTWNGDDSWSKGTNVALIAQAKMEGGTLNIDAAGKKYTVTGSITDLKTISGSAHTKVNVGTVTYNETRDASTGTPLQYRPYAVMKLVGGHKINIDDVTFNFRGNGTANNTLQGAGSWLFHTDGHDDNGDSTWVLGNGTKVNIDGKELIMYTSQYHNVKSFNIGFQNNGEISDTNTSENNYIWISMNDGGDHKRVMWFENKNSLILNGKNDVFAILGHESNDKDNPDGGGFSIMNSGILKLAGINQKGIIVNKNTLGRSTNNNVYNGAEIIFTTPMEITGSKSIGIIFNKFANLYGGVDFNEGAAASTVANESETGVLKFNKKTRESVLNLDLSGSENKGLYFDYDDTRGYGSTGSQDSFDVSNYKLNINGGSDNTAVYVKNGNVKIYGQNQSGTDNKININGGTKNVGIYTVSSKKLDTAATITLTGANESVGLYAKDATGTIENTGKISGTNLIKSIGIASNNSTIKNEGEVDIEGKGSVGIAATTNGTINSVGANAKIKATGNSSAAVYTDSGTVNLDGGKVDAEGGAINLYSNNNGRIYVSKNNTTVINTGQRSLAFMTDNGGKIHFENDTTAKIKGGSTAPERGTAFYYMPSSTTISHNGLNYGDFTNLTSDLNNAFDSTLGKLTLDMDSGSRLMIASKIDASLSNSSIGTALPSITIHGTDYKTAMLYMSYLNVDKPVNLDNPNDDYNKLELSNSSIENNSTMTGTQAGQVAIAQENIYNNPFNINWVTLTNNGTINLSGANSTAMYAKSGIIKNTNNITVGDSSTGIYGTDNSQISNTGVITIGSDSTGIVL